MAINALILTLQNFKTSVIHCCMLTCCRLNSVCVSPSVVLIMQDKHTWGSDFTIRICVHLDLLRCNWAIILSNNASRKGQVYIYI